MSTRVICHTGARADRLVAALEQAGHAAHKWTRDKGADVYTDASMRTVQAVIREVFSGRD